MAADSALFFKLTTDSDMKNAGKLYSLNFVHVAVAIFSLGSVSHAAQLQNYEVDARESSVSFSVKHIVVSEVHGRFKHFAAKLKFDETNLTNSSVTFTVETPSVDTDNERRDKDLRGPMFLDVTNYPQMSFVSHRVEKNGRDYALIGDLTLHGVTREIRVPFVYNGIVKDNMGKIRTGFSASFVINRQDWGISYNKVLDNGGLVAGNEVRVQLEIIAVKESDSASAATGNK
jgi:polyisoprenoid-binding protein YceI